MENPSVVVHPPRVQHVSNLPPELLSRIFALAKPQKRIRHITAHEVTISHVAIYWRAVAIATAHLWSNIEIYSERSLARIPFYLERSGLIPIDIEVDLYDYEKHLGKMGSEVSPLFLDEAINPLILHIDRWRYFHLFTRNENTTRDILLRFCPYSAPLLERIGVRLENTLQPLPLHDNGESPGPFSAGAPKLTRLELQTLYACPPVQNLTELRLQRSSISSPLDTGNLIDTLTQCPLLVTLTLENVIDAIFWPTPATPIIELQHLKLLSLTNDGLGLSKFLLALSAPGLESLWIESSQADHFQVFLTHPQVTAVKAPKFPELRYLTLQALSLSHLSALSRGFPTISWLHLSYCPMWNIRMLKELHSPPFDGSGDIKWPNLHTLAVRTTRDIQRNMAVSEALLGYASRRRHVGRPLRNILVDVDLLTILRRISSLAESVELRELSEEIYWEPGWLHRQNGDTIM